VEFAVLGLGAALVDTEVWVSESDLRWLGLVKGHMRLGDAAAQAHILRRMGLCGDIGGGTGGAAGDKKIHRACGGSAANSMLAAAHFGCRAHLTCQVGADAAGRFFLAELARAGVGANRNAQGMAGETGQCLVLVTPDAERSMHTVLGSSTALSPANLHPELFAAADYLYLEGYLCTAASPRAAAIRARELAQRETVKIALSLSDPGLVAQFAGPLREMAGARLDLLFCNAAEALAWSGCATLEEASEVLQEGAAAYAITLGAAGALCFDGRRKFQVAAPPVDAIDTNGAGDMFAGTMLACLSRGLDFSNAAAVACRAAAHLVTQPGARLNAAGYARLRGELGLG